MAGRGRVPTLDGPDGTHLIARKGDLRIPRLTF